MKSVFYNNSTAHIVCICYFYFHQRRNFADYMLRGSSDKEKVALQIHMLHGNDAL